MNYLDPALRVLLFIFAVIAMALLGSLIESQNATNPQVNFGIFSTAFAILFGVFYGLGAFFVTSLALPIAIFVIDFLDFVFTLAAACAIAAAIRCHSCSNSDYVASNKVTQGSKSRCHKAQAAVAFLFFATVVTIVQSVLATITLFSKSPFGSRKKSTGTTGLPAMSQV